MMGNTEETLIIITADEPWGSVMHTQLHYAFQLSKEYDVIYINPPRVWSPASGFIDYKRTYRVNSRLLVIPYRHVFPLRVFRKLFTFFNDFFTSVTIRKHIPIGKSEIILWRFDHFRYYNAWLPGKVKKIYHVVDNYVGKAGDASFARDADLVVVTSPRLKQHYLSLNNQVITIPQCIPEEDNEVNEALVTHLQEKYGKYILFVGTLTPEVDLKLLAEVASAFPANNLLLLGPVMHLNSNELEKLKVFQAYPNVNYIGSIPGLELKNYIKGAAVCLVPYKFTDERKVHIRSPLKILNYISQLRPVVSSMESELPDEIEMGVYFVSDAGSFIARVRDVLANPPVTNAGKVRKYLASVNYRDRINEILGKIATIDG